MPYDKYRNWKPRTALGFGTKVYDIDALKRQVLKDIHEAEDETDKLEILDSFEVYVERHQQEELAEHFALLLLRNAIQPLIAKTKKS